MKKSWNPVPVATRAAILAVIALASTAAGCAPAKAKEKKALELPSVSVKKPELRAVADSFTLVGSVQAASEVAAVSETSGKIVSMPVKTGDAVVAGSPLASVDKDLREATYIAAEAAFRKAEKDVQRAESLYADKLLADADMEAARLGEANAKSQYLVAKKELENTTIRSSIRGTVADTYASLGEQIAPGSKIALVVDASRLKVKVMLPEGAAVSRRAGDPVSVESPLFPSRTFEGRIESVSVRGDETHSFPTEVVLLGRAASELRAGMSVRLTFGGGGGGRKALLIPRAAVVGSLRDPEVFVVAGGVASLRRFVAGAEYGTDVEVLSGLSEGDEVVTSGQTLLADGQAVRVVKAGGSDVAD